MSVQWQFIQKLLKHFRLDYEVWLSSVCSNLKVLDEVEVSNPNWENHFIMELTFVMLNREQDKLLTLHTIV